MSDLGEIVKLAITRAYGIGIVQARIEALINQNRSWWTSNDTKRRNSRDIRSYNNDIYNITNNWDTPTIENYLVKEFKMSLEDVRDAIKRSSSNL